MYAYGRKPLLVVAGRLLPQPALAYRKKQTPLVALIVGGVIGFIACSSSTRSAARGAPPVRSF